MSGEGNVRLESTGLAKLVADLGKFVRNAADLRGIQAQNAPQATILNSMTVVAGAAAVRIPEAQQGDNFAFMLLLVETTSGAGRYDPGTGQPATAVRGLEIPAGGAAIALDGATNIRQFSIFGSGALAVTYVLFK
jgi:hypothetical protein